jgi:hypothetical protein
MAELLACSNNWLDETQERRQFVPNSTSISGVSGGTTTGTYNTGIVAGSYYYPYYSPWYVTSYTPVNLKLSEVEYLRKKAKDDKKLREILQKFTHLIQITVDFE